MAASKDDPFVERRTQALALVLLTSRDDLKVMSVQEDVGVDLLVSLTKDEAPTFEHFGVILKGSVEMIATARDAGRFLNSCMSRGAKTEVVTTPICVFLFNMTGSRGFYAWRDEPTTIGGLPKLRRHESLECKELNAESLEDILESVDRFYDALSRDLAS